MWYSIDMVTILNFYGTMISYFTQESIFELSKEVVTYKFSPEQIYQANLLARNTFPEGFLFGVSVPVVNGK